jgi:hypothetical protein
LNSTKRIAAVICVIALAAGLTTGCMKKAPQLTPEQLAAGIIATQHPVNQAEASKRGCECHLQK